MIYPVAQTNVIGSLNIAGVRIYQIKMDSNTVAVLIPITFLAVIPLLFIRRSFVFDSAIFYPEEVVIGGRVVVPRGVEVGKILPADLEFAVLDMDLTRYIHEVYDVGLN